MENVLKRIEEYAFEEIMGDRFGKYAKEIILDRAIPDVRDGLKPVQRRILYYMYDEHNTYDKSYIKCAYTVGGVLGKFHPHGDSSVYDAMVRMSQWWKQNTILIDIHGNNGSMDGYPAAAYRYTEARLSKISMELLKDLDKETVPWAPNFDDRFLEPTVLPAKFPNLLVNGCNGISAGYATNIPPHNLGEVIDATIKRIDSPNCEFDSILKLVKGPDFPTGGIAQGKQGIIDAFKTGRGRIVISSKIHFNNEKNKKQIIVDEVPFEVNKRQLVEKIDNIRIDKKIDGIAEVRDETDRSGLRIAIDLKKDANQELILNYLLKNTDLQISYNYNMVAIVNRTPKTLGLLEILDAYIDHLKNVILKRTEFDLKTYKLRYHIVEGLIKAISILDQVIKTIRSSKNKIDAKNNLVKEYSFTEEQAEAIVTLQLYRLTNTDVTILEEEAQNLQNNMALCNEILSDENKLKNVMKNELREIKKNYALPRKTEIKEEITEIKLEKEQLIANEQVVLVVTNEGYVKRVSLKSYKSSNEQTALKPGDFITGLYSVSTLDNLLLFTNLGNYLFVPVHKILECKWKDLGKHISNIVVIKENERIVSSMILKDKDKNIVMFTKNGYTKQVSLASLEVSRYNKPMTAIKLKENDELINVEIAKDEVILVTNNGLYLRYDTKEIPSVGIKASGVKAINLKDNYVIYASSIFNNHEYLNLFTNYNTGKRIKLNDLIKQNRAKKGSSLFKKVKSKDYEIVNAYLTDSKDINGLKLDTNIELIKNSDIPIMDILSTGSIITKHTPDLYFLVKELISFSDEKDIKENKQLSFNEFVEDFKI